MITRTIWQNSAIHKWVSIVQARLGSGGIRQRSIGELSRDANTRRGEFANGNRSTFTAGSSLLFGAQYENRVQALRQRGRSGDELGQNFS